MIPMLSITNRALVKRFNLLPRYPCKAIDHEQALQIIPKVEVNIFRIVPYPSRAILRTNPKGRKNDDRARVKPKYPVLFEFAFAIPAAV